MTLRVALLGAGRIGRVHAASIAADADSELVAVHDIAAGAAEALAAEFGIAVRNADDILSDRDVDAILIASSTDTHADLIERGAAAGKAIFCEKPIDLDLRRAHAVRRAVENATKPVMVGFNRRFDPNFAALRTALENGEIGKGELLSVTSYDPAPPPASYIAVSGGLFRDMMIHDFDMCCWLFGMPATVTASGACLVDPAIGAAGDVDTAVATLQYADGRLATIRNSRRAAYGYDQRIEILGASGSLAAGNEVENTIVRSTDAGVSAAKPVHFFLERYMRAYRNEWAAFVTAATEGTAPPATVQDGVNALALAEAANIALREGRTVPVTAELTGA